jgi:hypothetical protein
MNLTLAVGPLVSLIAGVLILIVPRLLNYIVALYLIVIGLLGLFGAGNYRVGGRADLALPESAVAATNELRPLAVYWLPETPGASGVQSTQM